MNNTKITVTMTPQQFDDLRDALRFTASNAKAVATDSHTDVKIRSEARQQHGRLLLLIEQVNS
jgi:hypothetical protein